MPLGPKRHAAATAREDAIGLSTAAARQFDLERFRAGEARAEALSRMLLIGLVPRLPMTLGAPHLWLLFAPLHIGADACEERP